MNYFDKYESIVIELKNEDEINYIVNNINNTISPNLSSGEHINFLRSLCSNIHDDEIPYIRYKHSVKKFTYGTLEHLKSGENSIQVSRNKEEYEEVFTIKNYKLFKVIILSGGEQFKLIPEYKPRTFKY